MNILHEDFESIVKEYGDPTVTRKLTQGELDGYSSQIPSSLIGFWEKYGFGYFFDGLLQLCEPNRFSPILSMIFGADKDLHHKDCHLIAYTAFGELLIWSERHRKVQIDLNTCRLQSRGLLNPQKTVTDLDRAAATLFVRSKKDYDYHDKHNKLLYARCQSIYGKLQEGECFGFVPALALGGSAEVEKVRRVSALEHFAILAQADTFYLTQLNKGSFEKVRPIG